MIAETMNISNFITWFLEQIYTIGASLLGYLDNIILHGNISLLEFTITIVIIGMFLSIILTLPTNVNRVEKGIERKNKDRSKK